MENLNREEELEAIRNSSFDSVNIDEFFDNASQKEDDIIQTGIIVFTDHQQKLIDRLSSALAQNASDRVDRLQSRLTDVTNLAKAIAYFPSLLERANTTTSTRTPEALVETLISYQEDGDTTLHMPSKAILGKGFLVAKIHTFFSMSKLAKNYAKMTDREVKEYSDETISMMFTLMAEDVYMNLIKDKNIALDIRREIANSLIILWEHRSDQTINDIAPVLQSVWTARRKLAPAFGTMMGTSELLMVTLQMDDQWNSFIRERLADPEVTQAMEEFLFGVSYEQILRLKGILRDQGVKSIGRDEVSAYLGERVKTDINLDYRDFYLLYTVRRDNARARQRLHLQGPKNTLEDHFFKFIMEQNREKQKNDTFAKEYL
ncbi:hypothetical protein [Treponema sp.]|uniref:hypothetical protein n=1 Tax=Treponema sp. TaxID=166 RepID=UPI002A81DDA0|nr:hypothetical protein [Treponema sp.]MCI6443091.1 hypothetical protein [Spirochaetia bacterium]MDY4131756.1 hypothetical protein [Treponema sp.]